MLEKIAGSVLKATLVSSGTVFSSISSAIYNGQEVLVNSVNATSSGNGFYYANHQLPNTPGLYVNAWEATVGGFTYRDRQYLKIKLGEAD